MKKIFAIFAVFFAFFATFLPNSMVLAEEEASTYVVTANSAVIYAQPNFTSEKLGILAHNDEVNLEMSDGAPVEYLSSPNADEIQANEYIFFKLAEMDVNGYIFSDLLTPKNSIITAIPSFNGQTNDSCNVFFAEDLEMIDSGITLTQGERIFLYEGFDKNLEYTAIAFVHENEVLYGFIETNFVSPDGINPIIITCIVIILAVLGIIFAWLFMKRKKIKLKKGKSVLIADET